MASSADFNKFHPPTNTENRLDSLPDHLSAATSGSFRGDARTLHVLNRLGFGPRPGDIAILQRMGIEKYIQQQLNPKSIAMPGWITQGLANSRTLNKGAYALYQRNNPRNVRLQQLRKEERRGFKRKNGKLTKEQRQAQRKAQLKMVLNSRAKENRAEQKKIQEQVQLPIMEASNARLIRAINSPRQLEEVMVNFWFNHFNVSKRKGFVRTWAGIYDEQAIRPYVLGSFRDLLGSTAHHPAMLFYLDNFRSKANAINENYARELLELHTLGVDGGYTLKDIQEVARVFTGWKFTPLKDGPRPQRNNSKYRDFFFDKSVHDFGTKTVLGQTIRGSGEQEGEQVLDLLARHPSTAKYIGFKLAQYFVADEPPSSLVNSLAQRFQSSQGNITAVLSTLFSSSEFWDQRYFTQKFKTPYEYLVSVYRATGQSNIDTRKFLGMLEQLGMPLYGCETPDGYENVRSAWLSPEGMMRRLSLATSIANGNAQANQRIINPNQLAQTLGFSFSGQTLSVLKNSPPNLQASGILGSPEMMMR